MGIDRAHLQAMTGGDAELAAEVLGLFAGELERLRPVLAAEPRPNPATLADTAHALKGGALGVGATGFAGACAELERAARSGDAALHACVQDVTERIDAALSGARALAQELTERGAAAFSRASD